MVEGIHKSYDLADGKCFSVMSPNIQHQEIPVDSFQSYIAIMVDRIIFEEIYKQYTTEIPVFKGEIFVPHPELVGMLRCFMLECNENRKENRLKDYLATLLVHYVARSLVKDNKETIPLYDRSSVDTGVAIFRIVKGNAFIWNISYNVRESEAPELHFR